MKTTGSRASNVGGKVSGDDGGHVGGEPWGVRDPCQGVQGAVRVSDRTTGMI